MNTYIQISELELGKNSFTGENDLQSCMLL